MKKWREKESMGDRKVVYPVFIKQAADSYLVYVPDLEINTEGEDLADAIAMARDAIGATCIGYDDINVALPDPSDTKQATSKAKEDADEDFDFSDGLLTFVDVDLVEYRRKVDNRAVKKNCTIPYWMSVEADRKGINYSKVLQEALASLLHRTSGASV